MARRSDRQESGGGGPLIHGGGQGRDEMSSGAQLRFLNRQLVLPVSMISQ